MRLVYIETGIEVKAGDKVKLKDGIVVTVEDFPKPHKPASSGKVYTDGGHFFVGVIGAQWIEREDQPEEERTETLKLHTS